MTIESHCNYGDCCLPLASKMRCAKHRYAGSTPPKIKICVIPDCGRPFHANMLCGTHNQRLRAGIKVEGMTLSSPVIKKGTLSGVKSGRWAGDEVTYYGAHHRMKAEKGRARDHMCACGRGAHHWAYDYTDPNERVDETTGLVYSVDMTCYVAMCASCHKKHDNLEKARRRERA